jgi:hypothetical protein
LWEKPTLSEAKTYIQNVVLKKSFKIFII